MTKNRSLDHKILALAIPAIVANITTPLLSLVDVAIVGHLGSAAYVAAIAVGGSLFSAIYWLFGFLRFGTSGLTAQAVGAGDEAQQRIILARSLAVALLFGTLLIILQIPVGKLALRFMDTDVPTAELAWQYFRILIWGAPAVLMQYAMVGWFVGMQNTRAPMWNSLIINVVNIAASLLLVCVFHLGIKGIATGTLIAQWVGMLVALFIAKPRRFPLSVLLQWSEVRHFFSINADIFLRTLCLIAVTVWFTRAGASQGAEILAVNTLLLQLFILFSYFMDGFAFSAEALCGRYLGAGDKEGLRRCIRREVQWGAAMALLFTAVYAIGGEAFLSLLTDDLHIMHSAAEFRLWAVGIPIAGFMAFTWDGIVIGLTRTRLMLWSMALSTAIFFILYFSLYGRMGNHALWLAFLAYLLTRGIALWLLSRRKI